MVLQPELVLMAQQIVAAAVEVVVEQAHQHLVVPVVQV
jgi:hypothetical protein